MKKAIAILVLIAVIVSTIFTMASCKGAPTLADDTNNDNGENKTNAKDEGKEATTEEIYVVEITENGEYKYALYSNDTIEILKYLNLADTFVDLIIPDTIDGYKVTSIGARVFSFYWNGVGDEPEWKIAIPDGVNYIGDGAFSGCKFLKNITIPDGVTYIGDEAFDRCDKLVSLSIPDSVTYIGKSAFATSPERSNLLTSLTIPDSVTFIGAGAFSGHLNLTIICSKDSAAHKYAVSNNVLFKLK
jgi:hypothetical protein